MDAFSSNLTCPSRFPESEVFFFPPTQLVPVSHAMVTNHPLIVHARQASRTEPKRRRPRRSSQKLPWFTGENGGASELHSRTHREPPWNSGSKCPVFERKKNVVYSYYGPSPYSLTGRETALCVECASHI
jgi:hypothetical protein